MLYDFSIRFFPFLFFSVVVVVSRIQQRETRSIDELFRTSASRRFYAKFLRLITTLEEKIHGKFSQGEQIWKIKDWTSDIVNLAIGGGKLEGLKGGGNARVESS